MDERSIEKFLAVYRTAPNPNTSSKLSLKELIFAQKIRPIFVRLLPRSIKKIPKILNFNTKIYKPYDNDFLGTTELERVTGGTVL